MRDMPTWLLAVALLVVLAITGLAESTPLPNRPSGIDPPTFDLLATDAPTPERNVFGDVLLELPYLAKAVISSFLLVALVSPFFSEEGEQPPDLLGHAAVIGGTIAFAVPNSFVLVGVIEENPERTELWRWVSFGLDALATMALTVIGAQLAVPEPGGQVSDGELGLSGAALATAPFFLAGAFGVFALLDTIPFSFEGIEQ